MKPATQRRRIVFVLGRLKTGGNETAALQLLARLDRSRFEPSLLVLSAERDSIADEFAALALPIASCRFDQGNRLSFVWRLRGQFRRIRPDAVLCYSYSAMHLWVHLAGRLAGVPQRTTRVASWFDWMMPQLTRLQRYSILVCNQEIAVSEYVGRRLRETGRTPSGGVVVIPNGCDVTGISKRAATARLRRSSDAPLSIVMVSRLEEAKDHATLLKAFASVVKQLPQARLRIVGDGPLRPSLERLSQDLAVRGNVDFLGLRRDVPEVLGPNDVFAFSTRTEGFPNALIEAMAAGLPVVSSDLPPCREILDGGRAGLLAPPGDAAAMAAALSSLLSAPPRAREVAAAGLRRVEERYQLVDMVQAYERVLADGR